MTRLFKEEMIINKVYRVEKQKAQTILNVDGNIEIYEENKAIGNKKILEKYSKINYSVLLDKNYNEKKTIIRKQNLSEIQEILEMESTLLLYGPPGIGKSFLVSEVKKNYDTIYISVKIKSKKEIYLYLISKLLSKGEIENKELINSEDIKIELEISMSENKKLFIFDDIETNPEIVEEITSLDLFDNKLLFISRISNIKASHAISKYKLNGFTDDEVREFLQINDIKLDTIKMLDLIEASEGNPLYLYYFSRYQVTPLPKSLIKFQDALWNEMTPLQKGILSLVSTSLFELPFEEIKECIKNLNDKNINIFNFQNELDNISHLLVKNQGYYSIFHLSLSEYILQVQEESGVINSYKKVLADVKIKVNNFLEAVYLLIDVPESNLKEIILIPIIKIQRLGLLNFGVKVLKKAIELYNGSSKSEIKARGYAYHNLTLFYKDLYMITESIEANNLSIECFDKINDIESLLNAKLFQALDLLENNNEEEAFILVEEIKKNIPEKGYLKASLCVNLSKFYIDLTNYVEAKKYAELAYIEFKNEKNKVIRLDGIKSSLNNLAISYSFLKGRENIELSIKYGELLYGFSLKTYDLRTQASISNLLTRSYREINNYKRAHEFCDQAIKLSKSMKSSYLLIMNIINKGNIYRDEEKKDKALKYYIEAKQYSSQNNILREEVRSLKLILDIYLKYNNYQEGKIVAEEFLEKSLKLGTYYRISEAYDVLSEISYYLNEDKWKVYAMKSLKILFEEKKYEEVINNTLKIVNIFNEKLTQAEVQFYFELLIKSEAYEADLSRVMAFIATDDLINFSQKIDMLKLIIKKPNIEKILAREILIEFIEEIQKENDKIYLNEIIELLGEFLENKDKEEFNAYFLIAIIGFSRSFNIEIQNKLLEKIQSLSKGFYYRKALLNELIITVSCSKDLKLQIICDDSDLVAINMAIIIAILIKFNTKKILEEMTMLDQKYYTISIDTYSRISKHAPQEIIENIIESKSKSRPYIVGNNKEKRIISFFINDNFQDNIFLLKEKGTKGLLSLLLQLFILISKAEEIEFVEKKSINLLKSLLLPPIKNKFFKEKIDLLQVENDLNCLVNNL